MLQCYDKVDQREHTHGNVNEVCFRIWNQFQVGTSLRLDRNKRLSFQIDVMRPSAGLKQEPKWMQMFDVGLEQNIFPFGLVKIGFLFDVL